MAKKSKATKSSESQTSKTSDSSETNPSQHHVSSEHYTVETPKRQDVNRSGRADIGPEILERHDAIPSDTFRLQGNKSFKDLGRQDVKQVKLTLYLPADLAQRFAVHAAMLELDKSELFAALVRAHCTRFEIRDRGETSDPGQGA